MSRSKVVFLHGLKAELVELIQSLAPEFFEIIPVSGNAPEEEQSRQAGGADFLMVYRAELKEAVVRASSRARLIQLLAAGYDRIDLDLLREVGIPCANNSGANSWAVADHTVLLMLALLRRLIPADRATREGRWREPITGLNTFEMAGKRVGILGIGNIGKKVARRVQAFEARVQYYDKYPLDEAREREAGLTRVSLDDLFRTSDVITCHLPLTEETRHLVNRESLALMKPGAILVNTSRGGVIREPDLIEALRGERIGGAALDVFDQEPLAGGHPLAALENVILTAHTAGTTRDTWFRRADFAFRNMERVLKGEAPVGLI